MKLLIYFTMAIIIVIGSAGGVRALAPSEVLVVYNANPFTPDDTPDFDAISSAVAHYYAQARLIPDANVVGLSQVPYSESIAETQYVHDYLNFIASPLWTNYLSKPEYSHIKCIVLCYGIPSRIIYQPNYDMSVDSALTL